MRGTIMGKLVPTFWAGYKKVINYRNYPAAVVSGVGGIILHLDAKYLMSCSDDNLEFTLSHELMHIASKHFTRATSFLTENNIPRSVMMQVFAPFADVVVNESLSDTAGFKEEKDRLLTYATTGLPRSLDTVEKIWMYLIDHMQARSGRPMNNDQSEAGQEDTPDEDEAQGGGKGQGKGGGKKHNDSEDETDSQADGSSQQQDGEDEDGNSGGGSGGNEEEQDEQQGEEGKGSCGNKQKGKGGDKPGDKDKGKGGGSNFTVIQVGADGQGTEVRTGKKNGPVVVMSHVDPLSQEQNEQEAKEALSHAMKTAGTAPANLLRTIKEWLDEKDEAVLRGWELLEHLLVGERSTNVGRVVSYTRMNRRTRMIPGYRHEKGFRTMMFIDESGSMSDEEVSIGFNLVKKIVMRETSDLLYLCHWDTEPAAEIDEVKYEHETADLTRKKTGGTIFSEMFTHPLVVEKDVDLFVIITDGEVYDWPEIDPPVPTLWIITTPHGYTEWETRYGMGLAVDVSN